MPDPTDWEGWFTLGDELLAEARQIVLGAGRGRGLVRLAGQAAEAYLKGLLRKNSRSYKPMEDRHDLEELLRKAILVHPSLAQVSDAITLLAWVTYEDAASGNEESCSWSVEAFYNPNLSVDVQDAEARLAAIERVAGLATQLAGYPV